MILLFRETCYFAGRAEETGKAGDIPRNLANDVPDRPSRHHVVELAPKQAEVLTHT